MHATIKANVIRTQNVYDYIVNTGCFSKGHDSEFIRYFVYSQIWNYKYSE